MGEANTMQGGERRWYRVSHYLPNPVVFLIIPKPIRILQGDFLYRSRFVGEK
jgi:hypothetical protein